MKASKRLQGGFREGMRSTGDLKRLEKLQENNENSGHMLELNAGGTPPTVSPPRKFVKPHISRTI